MRFSQSFLAVAIPALAAALPTGEIEHNLEDRQCTGCAPPPKDLQPSYCPVIDSEENFTDPEWQAGVSTKSGNTLQFAQTYTQGSIWTVGGSLGLDFAKIIEGSASLSAEVTESVEHSVMVGSETSCPEGGKFSCSLLIYPGTKRVKGHMVEIGPTENCAAGIHAQEGEWEMVVPRKDKSNNGVRTTDLCTCDNLEGKDDEGHPEKVCLEECVVPE